MDKTAEFYSERAERFAQQYESLLSEQVHRCWLPFLPSGKAAVLDVGAGSGRDAAWLAGQGHEVIAVEPATGMIQKGRALHPSPAIQWVQDCLPALKKVHLLNLRFDLILASAVWMHVPPTERERALRKMSRLLKPGGKLVITLRHGTFTDGRDTYPTSSQEMRQLAKRFALDVVLDADSPDFMGRPQVTWTTVVLVHPDDGTGALPLLRHVIINDAKSSTYKLALLRVILRIADGAPGAVLKQTDDHVVLPFGLVALYWLRSFRSLILEHQCRQNPPGGRPSFATSAFQATREISPYDLRIGTRFQDRRAEVLTEALRDARNTIKNMPAFFTTYPNSKTPVFPCESRQVRSRGEIRLDIDFLASFGTFTVPRHLWEAMSHYACWIEPAIVNEWSSLMARYEGKAGQSRTLDEYRRALRWLDEEHDTALVRHIVADRIARGQKVYCVWTGQTLREQFHVDHCFPFAHWPNNDLWNLMPAHPKINTSKSDRLPHADALEAARERILDWWTGAYHTTAYQERFSTEATTSLPMVGVAEGNRSLDTLWTGVQYQRLRLKADQQLVEWHGLTG